MEKLLQLFLSLFAGEIFGERLRKRLHGKRLFSPLLTIHLVILLPFPPPLWTSPIVTNVDVDKPSMVLHHLIGVYIRTLHRFRFFLLLLFGFNFEVDLLEDLLKLD